MGLMFILAEPSSFSWLAFARKESHSTATTCLSMCRRFPGIIYFSLYAIRQVGLLFRQAADRSLPRGDVNNLRLWVPMQINCLYSFILQIRGCKSYASLSSFKKNLGAIALTSRMPLSPLDLQLQNRPPIRVRVPTLSKSQDKRMLNYWTMLQSKAF